MRLTTNSGVTPTRLGTTIRRLVAAGILVAMSLAMPRPAPSWRGHHRALPQGDR